jgi:RNA-binding protein
MNNQQEKTLLPWEKRKLKELAHHIDPVVQIGKKGLTEGLFREINEALLAHELIKIQISPIIKENLSDNLARILGETGAEHIDTIGNIVILFRKRNENSGFDF